MKEGVSGNSGSLSSLPSASASALLISSRRELPELPFRHLAPYVFLSRDQPSHIRSGEEV